MATEAPLSRLVLQATSVVDDLGFVALGDLSRAVGDDPATAYCVIGGHMVTALVARWQLGAELYRVTGDVDLGVPPVLAQDARLIERLMSQGYQRTAGNRFARIVDDIPVELTGISQPEREAIIDILVPAYTSRPRQNLKFGNHLVTTEVPGLAFALNRGPTEMSLELHRLNGQTLDIVLAFPDEVGALVLKSLAWAVRSRPTDVVDIWRCLEIAFAAGLGPSDFREGIPAEGAAIVRSMFASRDGQGMTALVSQQRMSGPSADERFTRLRALITACSVPREPSEGTQADVVTRPSGHRPSPQTPPPSEAGTRGVEVDESGVSLLPSVRSTWAPTGQTPILRHRFNWKRASMAAASCYRADASSHSAELVFRMGGAPRSSGAP